MLNLLYVLILMVCVLLGVAFLTLLERNLLGYIQLRKGPNKVGFIGILQPFSDAIKLFTKENIYPVNSNFIPYYVSPILSLMLSLLVWVTYNWGEGILDLSLGVILILCILSMNVYPLLGCGWFSNSKYSLLGCIRSIAQTISYEVSLAIVLVVVVMMSISYNMNTISLFQEKVWNLIMLYFLSMVWLVIILAETNRSPFDFAEGESELVSGFNIEYSGGGFALIFMAEYGSILFMSMLMANLFMGGYSFTLFMKIVFVSFGFIFIRGLLPRFRYDKLMYMAWKILLPLSLVYLISISLFVWSSCFSFN